MIGKRGNWFRKSLLERCHLRKDISKSHWNELGQNLQRAFWSEMAALVHVPSLEYLRCDGGTAVWSLGLKWEWVMGKRVGARGGQLKEIQHSWLKHGWQDWLKFLQPNKNNKRWTHLWECMTVADCMVEKWLQLDIHWREKWRCLLTGMNV